MDDGLFSRFPALDGEVSAGLSGSEHAGPRGRYGSAPPRRQAVLRHCFFLWWTGCAESAVPAHGGAHKDCRWRRHFLPASPDRSSGTAISNLQIPHNGVGGGTVRAICHEERGCPRHLDRKDSAEDQTGRIPAALECVEGGDEPGRPETGSSPLRPALHCGTAGHFAVYTRDHRSGFAVFPRRGGVAGKRGQPGGVLHPAMHSAKAETQSGIRRARESAQRHLDHRANRLSVLDRRAPQLRNYPGCILSAFLPTDLRFRATACVRASVLA